MVFITIVTADNPSTIFFEEHLPAINYVGLVSCSLHNSWHNLTKSSRIGLYNKFLQKVAEGSLTAGNYTFKNLAGAFDTFASGDKKLETVLNDPCANLIVKTASDHLMQIEEPLSGLLGANAGSKYQKIKVFNLAGSPENYFIYCDLVDASKNFLNGKKSNLLAKVEKLGEAFERINCHVEDILHNTKAAKRDIGINSLTISVRDENDKLFDFKGQKLDFTLLII